MINRSDVILVNAFFSDSAQGKIRPAIVLSSQSYNGKGFLLLGAITASPDEYCIPISQKDAGCAFAQGSAARFDGIIRSSERQAIRKIGKVSKEFHSMLVEKIISTLK